jgi:hypothetical protein
MIQLYGQGYTFIRHTIDYPPEGEGWWLAFVVPEVFGGGSYRDNELRDQIGTVVTSIMGVWARQKTEEDKEREFRTALGDHTYPSPAQRQDDLGARIRLFKEESDKNYREAEEQYAVEQATTCVSCGYPKWSHRHGGSEVKHDPECLLYKNSVPFVKRTCDCSREKACELFISPDQPVSEMIRAVGLEPGEEP